MSFWSPELTFRQNPGYTEASNIMQTYRDWLSGQRAMPKAAGNLLRAILSGRADSHPMIAKLADIGPALTAMELSQGYDPQLSVEQQANSRARNRQEMLNAQAMEVIRNVRGMGEGLLQMKQQGRLAKMMQMGQLYNNWANLAGNSYQGQMEGGLGGQLLGGLMGMGSSFLSGGLGKLLSPQMTGGGSTGSTQGPGF